MLARCSRCRNTFPASRFGRQSCPHCGAEVEIREPPAEGALAGPPPLPDPYAPPAAQDEPEVPNLQPIAWERRAELGTWPALRDTVKLAISEPSRLFESMQYETAPGAHLYFLLVAVLPQMLGGLLNQLLNDPQAQLEQLRSLYSQMNQKEAAEGLGELAELIAPFMGLLAFGVILVVIPIFSFLALYVFSGLTHLILRLLGRASGGFTATFKTFVYASTPGIFAVLPGCGPIVYWAWSTILEIVGITKAHRTTAGYATIAVLGFHFVLLCCACGLPAMVLIAALSSAGLSGP